MPLASSQHIDWRLLSNALEYYDSKHYRYVEVPWIVRKEITLATLPVDAKPFSVEGCGDLVGSAEQSFIQMMVDDEVYGHKYMTISPCFRDDQVDDIHQKHFMKLELIDLRGCADFNIIMSDAAEYMSQFLDDKSYIKEEKISDNQIDLMLVSPSLRMPVKIGSYGYRSFSVDGVEYTWHYGTGLAEPRFSNLLKVIR